MAYGSKAYALTQKAPPLSFIERHVEMQTATGIDLKTNDTSKEVFVAIAGLGRFCPTELILVATTITGLITQPDVTIQGETFTCTMTAANDYMVCQIATANKALIAESGSVFFTVAVLANATTYTAQAFVRGFYTGI